MNKIKVFIVEDHQLIIDAWNVLLSRANDIEIIGSTGDYDEIYPMVTSLNPDVILMDVNIRGGSGLDCTAELTKIGVHAKIIGLSVFDDLIYVKNFFDNGAVGYLTKNASCDELLVAIRRAYRDEMYVCNEVRDRQFYGSIANSSNDNAKELTKKEIEIIQCIAAGMTSIQIAENFNISKRTVEVHRYNILKKLNLPNAALLSAWAKSKGYV